MDKTTNYVTVPVSMYHCWVLGYLSNNAKALHWYDIINIHKEAEENSFESYPPAAATCERSQGGSL
eukprot:9072604-Ditylum_brightwellii.AAC.1